QKTDFYRSEHQKRKDEICPFSSLAFFQPTTVDKEPKNSISGFSDIEFYVNNLNRFSIANS
ncbi:hypothetical protein RK790_08545, partial [Streptococcus pneumoniae]|nr:hypothetical protein [Streptococcus pneumoniae]MDS5552333.1 hypothetical protein [Streptococcus pneumoniae]MDT6220189.1 hypothetical protein [Streptococcus pneumoniae]